VLWKLTKLIKKIFNLMTNYLPHHN
jgi:hypothetical protein